MSGEHHALYRFYGAAGELLYVGITRNPSARWKAHGRTKEWWTEVARIDLETFESRESVLAAERAAIRAEHPRYNKVHNGTGDLAAPVVTPARDPLSVGTWVALGLRDGRCPVGEITAVDQHRLTVQLTSFLTGCLMDRYVTVDRDDVLEFEVASDYEIRGGQKVWLDRNLGTFQTDWKDRYAHEVAS